MGCDGMRIRRRGNYLRIEMVVRPWLVVLYALLIAALIFF